MTEVFGTCTARSVWFVTKLISPEGPNNGALSLWRLANISGIEWMESRWGQRVTSIISPKSPWVRRALTETDDEKKMGTQSDARTLTVALELLLRSGTFSSISVEKEKKLAWAACCGLEGAKTSDLTV